MSLFTSTDFASACAAGTDWRDTSKNVLEKLDEIRTQGDDFNFGFLYISDHLAEDANSILTLFKSVLKIDHWIGSVGMGVLGCGQSFVDQPAVSAMIGRFDKDSFCVFPAEGDDQSAVADWLENNVPMLGIVHGDPMAEEDPQQVLQDLGDSTNSFLIGGLSSSRHAHYQIADELYENSVSGAFFTDSLQVSTTLSQGCHAIAEAHTITKTDQNVILELDNKPALDVLQDDLRARYAKKHDVDIKSLTLNMSDVETSDHIPAEFRALFQGDIHAAFPFSQSDQNDYMVRSLTGVYAEERSISVAEQVDVGMQILFSERDAKSVVTDLSQALVALQKRVTAERGSFTPKAALYISCVARGFSQDPTTEENETDLIYDIFGAVPMVGFYAGGEISNSRLYGYTGVIALFF